MTAEKHLVMNRQKTTWIILMFVVHGKPFLSSAWSIQKPLSSENSRKPECILYPLITSHQVEFVFNTFGFFFTVTAVPSGELLHFAMERSTMLFMGKSTISMVIFHCYVSSPEGNHHGKNPWQILSRFTWAPWRAQQDVGPLKHLPGLVVP